MQTPPITIQQAETRSDVQITLPDGLVLQGAVGTTLEVFLQAGIAQGKITANSTLIAAICDGKLRELTFPVERDASVLPIFLASDDGGRIYRRSLAFLMATAVNEVMPGTLVSVKYSVPDGGFFCEVEHRPPFSPAELKRIEDHMREIVAANAPIIKRSLPLDEIKHIFEERGEVDKVRLLQYRAKQTLTVYSLRGRTDYYYGYMVPSTGYLNTFKLADVEDGFILQYPLQDAPADLSPIETYSKLRVIFREADRWLERMYVEDIGRLNQAINSGRIQELILVAEALHERNVASIASDIGEQSEKRGVRLVLIAGPSSAGKTTFAKRLAIQLLAVGLRPFTLELDNYFVDREKTPLDEHGNYDFEALAAVDLPLFNQHLLKLMNGEQVQLPNFDFKLGKRVPGRLAQLHRNQIIILEGIHGLNPGLVPDIPSDKVFRVYVSALTQLNIDSQNRVPTTDVRLLRRIVRDATHRGYTATDTLDRWRSVRRGEKRNIFPYQENADRMFNSALVYELAALRPFAEPLLLQVEPLTPAHLEANRLLSFLRWVMPLQPEQQEMIPDTSLLREFVGGSILRNYHPDELER